MIIVPKQSQTRGNTTKIQRDLYSIIQKRYIWQFNYTIFLTLMMMYLETKPDTHERLNGAL